MTYQLADDSEVLLCQDDGDFYMASLSNYPLESVVEQMHNNPDFRAKIEAGRKTGPTRA